MLVFHQPNIVIATNFIRDFMSDEGLIHVLIEVVRFWLLVGKLAVLD